MKKKKLELNKETIAKLNNEELKSVNGGILWSLIACPASYDSECVTICPSRCNTLDDMWTCREFESHVICNTN